MVPPVFHLTSAPSTAIRGGRSSGHKGHLFLQDLSGPFDRPPPAFTGVPPPLPFDKAWQPEAQLREEQDDRQDDEPHPKEEKATFEDIP